MAENELKEFIHSIEQNTTQLNVLVNRSKDKLGQSYFLFQDLANNLNSNLTSMKLYYDLDEQQKEMDTIPAKALSVKFNRLAQNVKNNKLSVISESDLISLDYQVRFDELKFNTLFHTLIENASSMKATVVHINIIEKNKKVHALIKNNGVVGDKNKSAPFQKIGHKLILKICKQLAYDVDFIKSDNGLLTRITF